MPKLFAILSLISCLAFLGKSQQVNQWRGINRDGVFIEKNLLSVWPEKGPDLIQKYENIGNGFSSPVFNSESLFVTGQIDSTDYLFSFGLKGNLLWKKEIGIDKGLEYPGPRSTPTLVGNLIYVCSPLGEICCFDARNGEKKWSKNMLRDLHGRKILFGYSESLLVDEDKLFCSPGGADTNVVALNRFSGKIEKIYKGNGDSTSYVSPIIIKMPQRKIFVNSTAHHLVGIDLKSGELLWTIKYEISNDIHCNSPIFENGYIYDMDVAGNGTEKLKLSDDGTQISEVWKFIKLGNGFNGFVKSGDYIYTSQSFKKCFESIDAATGQVVDTLKSDRVATIFADNMLYCYSESGKVNLIKPEDGKLNLVSSFKIDDGTNEHIAHPVINNGILYIRHGNVLLAYDIRRKNNS